MRSTSEGTSVRLYHLSDGPEGGAAQTLLYGTLAVIEISLMIRAVKLGPGARILPKGVGGGMADTMNEPVPAKPRTIQFDQ